MKTSDVGRVSAAVAVGLLLLAGGGCDADDTESPSAPPSVPTPPPPAPQTPPKAGARVGGATVGGFAGGYWVVGVGQPAPLRLT